MKIYIFLFSRCVHGGSWTGDQFIQNMVFGQSEQCPEGIIVREVFDDNGNNNNINQGYFKTIPFQKVKHNRKLSREADIPRNTLRLL